MDIWRGIKYFLRSRKNSFENHWKIVEARHHYGNQELLCEQIGKSLCESLDAKHLNLNVVLSDIMDYATENMKNPDKKHMSWLALHLSLGICFKYKVEDRQVTMHFCEIKSFMTTSSAEEIQQNWVLKHIPLISVLSLECNKMSSAMLKHCRWHFVALKVVRNILLKLLKHRHGIDCGIFMNELIQTPNDVAYEDLPPKAMYFLRMCAGLKIDLTSESPDERILIGPSRIYFAESVRKGSCMYLDLPIVSSSYDSSYLSSIYHNNESPIMIACTKLKPKVVLLLLQHGASPVGQPMQYLLTTLGSVSLFPNLVGSVLFQRSIGPHKECLAYCLRAVRQLKLSFTTEMIREADDSEVYFVREDVVEHIPKHLWSSPSSLQHLCRFAIVQTLSSVDRLPVPKHLLCIPNNLKNYLTYTS